MMSRAVLALLAVLVLGLATAVAGCGDDEGDGGGTTATTGTNEQQQASFETVEDGVLTVGSDIPFPPFEFRRGGELTGLDVELVNEMAERLGLETRWVDTSFDTIFTQLAGGRYDVVASATTITPERARQVNFTEPYFASQQALIVNTQQNPDVQSLEDLQSGQTIAVQRGTTGESYARDNVPEGVQVRSFPEAPDTYTALEAGNVDAVLFDEPSAVAEVEDRQNLEIVDTIDTGERYGFAVNPRNEALLQELNRVLQEMIEDGTYQQIYDNYESLPEGGSVAQNAGGAEAGGGAGAEGGESGASGSTGGAQAEGE